MEIVSLKSELSSKDSVTFWTGAKVLSETRFTANVCDANEPGTDDDFSKGLKIEILVVLTSVVENGILFFVEVIVIGLGDVTWARFGDGTTRTRVERTVAEGIFVGDKPTESCGKTHVDDEFEKFPTFEQPMIQTTCLEFVGGSPEHFRGGLIRRV
jgi:hypothetical protein